PRRRKGVAPRERGKARPRRAPLSASAARRSAPTAHRRRASATTTAPPPRPPPVARSAPPRKPISDKRSRCSSWLHRLLFECVLTHHLPKKNYGSSKRRAFGL